MGAIFSSESQNRIELHNHNHPGQGPFETPGSLPYGEDQHC